MFISFLYLGAEDAGTGTIYHIILYSSGHFALIFFPYLGIPCFLYFHPVNLYYPMFALFAVGGVAVAVVVRRAARGSTRHSVGSHGTLLCPESSSSY